MKPMLWFFTPNDEHLPVSETSDLPNLREGQEIEREEFVRLFLPKAHFRFCQKPG